MRAIQIFLSLMVLLNSFGFAQSVTVNGTGSTFVINKVAGFDGDLGAEREAVFVAAAQVWADLLVSPIDISVDASFTALSCSSLQAVLGSAGPNYSMNIPSNAASYNMLDNVTYPIALANALAETDFKSSGSDITAQFNASVDNNDNCLSGVNWYYGLDHNPPGYDIDFFEVVLHELGHGIGILSLVDNSGIKLNGKNDSFILNLKDETTGLSWASMTQTEILASRTNTGNLVWSGANVNTLSGELSSGVNNNQVQMYAPENFESGSSVSHFDTALTPNELMEPQYEGNTSYQHSVALLKDIGWDIVETPNETPVITAQSSLTIDEDSSLTLTLADLTVVDADSSYPNDFSLTLFSGSHYSVNGSTITPIENYSGTLLVPAKVHDGHSSSDLFNITITVTAVNDAPVISAQQSIVLSEDNQRTLASADLVITDPDSSVFTISAAAGDHYSVSNESIIIPDANWFGTLVVPVTVNDGTVNSNSFNVDIVVNAVNDAPVILATPNLTTNEDTSIELSINDFTVKDVDDSVLTLQLSSGDHFSVSGNKVMPELNYVGNLLVDVRINDGQTYSGTETISISVNAVNDAPKLNAITDYQITYGDSFSLQLVGSDIDGDDLTYNLNTAPSWLTINASGLITGTSSYGDIGSHDINASVLDASDSDSISFSLTVVDITSADISVDLTVNEPLVNSNQTATVSLNVKQLGPVASAEVSAEIDFDSEVTFETVDSRCIIQSTTQLLCTELNLLSSNASGTDFDINFNHVGGVTLNMIATASAVEVDPNSLNNLVDASLTILSDTDTLPNATVLLGSSSSQAVQLFDFDDNERTDIVFANNALEQSLVYEMNASATDATQRLVLPNVSDSVDVQVADFNNDSHLDILLVNNNADSLVFINNGSNQFFESIVIGNSDASSVVIVDLNQDDYLDIVIGNQGGSGNDVYTNSMGDSFVLVEQLGDSNTTDIDTIDYNRDGYLDIVTANQGDVNLVYLNNGVDQSISIFASNAIILGHTSRDSNVIVVADTDDDGVLNEIIIGNETNAGEGSIEIYRIAENQAQTNITNLASGDIISISVFHQDDIIMLAALNRAGIVYLYQQTGGDDFSIQRFIETDGGVNIALDDVDLNNSVDLVVANNGAANQIFMDIVSYTPSLGNSITNQQDNTDTETVTVTVVTKNSTSTTVTTSGSLSLFLLLLGLVLFWTKGRTIKH